MRMSLAYTLTTPNISVVMLIIFYLSLKLLQSWWDQFSDEIPTLHLLFDSSVQCARLPLGILGTDFVSEMLKYFGYFGAKETPALLEAKGKTPGGKNPEDRLTAWLTTTEHIGSTETTKLHASSATNVPSAQRAGSRMLGEKVLTIFTRFTYHTYWLKNFQFLIAALIKKYKQLNIQIRVWNRNEIFFFACLSL